MTRFDVIKTPANCTHRDENNKCNLSGRIICDPNRMEFPVECDLYTTLDISGMRDTNIRIQIFRLNQLNRDLIDIYREIDLTPHNEKHIKGNILKTIDCIMMEIRKVRESIIVNLLKIE